MRDQHDAPATDDEMQPGERFPVMYCREERMPRGTPVWTFRCPGCGRKHIHAPEPGHRIAHCPPDTRFYERGYVLALDRNHRAGRTHGKQEEG